MNVECTRLPSGLTVVTENMPHLESVALGTWIKSGSRNETEAEHGIAHLLEHMAFKGTNQRTARQIAEEIENVGGEVKKFEKPQSPMVVLATAHPAKFPAAVKSASGIDPALHKTYWLENIRRMSC